VSDSQRLHIVRNGVSISTATDSIELIPCGQSLNNPKTDILVLEEDCWQVLSSQPRLPDIDYHPIRVMTDLIDQKPLHPGDVIIRGNQWLAIVYDLDKSPICQPEWVARSLERILALTETLKISSITLPVLGSTHGDLARDKSLDLLRDALQHHEGTHLRRVILVVEDNHLNIMTKHLFDWNQT